MKYISWVVVVFLLSCGSGKPKEKKADTTDTTAHKPGSISPSQPGAGQPPLASEINNLLSEKFGGTLQVMTDADAKWQKDEFDYFIAPKRKSDPEYPYACRGDFNGDGQQDAAALIKPKNNPGYQLAIVFGNPLDKHRISFWTEDIDVCAVSTYPKGELEGIDKPKVQMKGDGINVEFFERATFVIYWDGKGFQRTHTGD